MRKPLLLVEKHPQLVTAICLSVLAVLAICLALSAGQACLVPNAAALVISGFLGPLCSRIPWAWIARPIAALLALIIVGAITYLAFSLIAQPGVHWVEDAPQTDQRAELPLRKL